MKCPYRKHVYIFRNSIDSVTGKGEEFEDCYGSECPHYDEYEGKSYCTKVDAQRDGTWKG